MNQEHMAVNLSVQESAERETNLMDVMITLARHRKAIIGIPAIVTIVSAALSFTVPNVYKASTKLLPPQQGQSSAAALLSQLGGAAGLAAGVAGIKNPSDLYVGMLKSRTIADNLVAKFELKKAYDEEFLEKARKQLEENTSISSSKDGLITIEVEDKDQKRVAPLANAYVSELLKLTRVVAVTEAGQRRMFYERQLEQAKNNLATAEIALKSKLDTHGVISVDVESRVIVETVGRLRAQISAKEVQLNSMRAFVTESNPNYLRTQQELSSLRAELSKLENGRSEGPNENAGNHDRQIGLENIKLLRDVKYYQTLYELLAKQYEIARLDEAKDPGIIQVLDQAVEPERKFKPKRALIVITSALFALFGAVAWAFLCDAKRRSERSATGAAQWAELKNVMRRKKAV
jgi:uncharacterized protein involved in exopolysaccharide biosynthesis